jgi:hypothetical protein
MSGAIVVLMNALPWLFDEARPIARLVTLGGAEHGLGVDQAKTKTTAMRERRSATDGRS